MTKNYENQLKQCNENEEKMYKNKKEEMNKLKEMMLKEKKKNLEEFDELERKENQKIDELIAKREKELFDFINSKKNTVDNQELEKIKSQNLENLNKIKREEKQRLKEEVKKQIKEFEIKFAKYEKDNIEMNEKRFKEYEEEQKKKINEIKENIEKELKRVNNIFKNNKEINEKYEQKFRNCVNRFNNNNFIDFCDTLEKNTLCPQISLSSYSEYFYLNEKNLDEESCKASGVRGGCVLKIKEDIKCVEIKELINENILNIIKNQKKSNLIQISENGINEKYLVLKTDLKYGYFDDEIISKLINYKQPDYRKESPEIYSVVANNKNNVINEFKKNPKQFEKITDNGMCSLLYSMALNSKDISKYLIQELPLNIIDHSTDLQFTPLHYAVMKGENDIVEYLIKKGAKLNECTKKEGLTPYHLAAENGNYNCLKLLLSKNNNLEEALSSDKKNALYSAVSNSLLCTKLLLNKSKYQDNFDTFNYSIKDYSLLNGRVDCYNYCNMKNLKKENSNNTLKEIKKGEKKYFNKLMFQYQIDHIYYFEDLINVLCSNMKKGDVRNSQKISISLEKNVQFLNLLKNNSKLSIDLIESAVSGKDKIFLNYLSRLINVNEYPIASWIGKYGLINWVNEAIELGLNIFDKNPKYLNGKNIFDFAIQSGNSVLIKEILNIITEIDNETLSNLICDSLLSNNNEIINLLYNKISENKFEKNKISFKKLGKTNQSTSLMLKYAYEIKSEDINSIDIIDAIKYSRPSFLKSLLSYKDILNQKIEPFNFLKISQNEKRNDNTICLCEIFPEIKNKMKDYYDSFYKRCIYLEEQIKNIDLKNNNFGKFINELDNVIKNNEIGLFQLPNTKKLLIEMIVQDNLTILPFLKSSNKIDLFIQNEYNKKIFDNSILSESDLNNILSYLDIKYENNKEQKFKEFLNIINICNQRLKESKLDTFFIEKVINVTLNNKLLNEKTYLIENDEGKLFLHIISDINEINLGIPEKINKIVLELKEIFSKDIEKISYLINKQDNYGNTFLMYLLNNNHFMISKTIFSNYQLYIDYSKFNIKGDTIF